MTCRFEVHKVVALLTVAWVSTVSVPDVWSQENEAADVFSDVELPDIAGDELPGEDELGSAPEELPLGDRLPERDPLDQLPSDPVVEDAEESMSLESAIADENLPIGQAAPPAPRQGPSLDVTNPVVEEDIGVGHAELVPDETVKERYPDGRVRIERGVSLDENDNYINHGPWKMWDREGNLLVEGMYQAGERHGRWVRLYQPDEAELFGVAPYSMFTPPFRSQADFRNGKLEGRWIVTDKHQRKISDWLFTDGRRQGVATWWYPNLTKMRELTYEFGQPDGELIEWNENAEIITRVEYRDGRRLDKTTRAYKDGQKQVEGMVLHARLAMKNPDDWWTAKLANYTREGEDQKHGEWTAWYPNGQKKFTGEFLYGRPTGEFTWWYTNGQVSLNGSYENGEKVGGWTWWHETGLKSIQGFYESNSPVGRWIWWHENGRVAQRVDFSGDGEPRVVTQRETTLGSKPSATGPITVGRRSK